jgi:hypothetical protein
MKSIALARAVCALGILAGGASGHAQVLFREDFESNTSSNNWSVFVGYYQNSATNDFIIDWAFDYSQQTYNFFSNATDFEARTIPPAPNSNGGTRGVKFRVNQVLDGGDSERFGISMYPRNQNFSGDYVLRFDLFMNHASYIDSGAGTTEYATYGINFRGNQVNWTTTALGSPFSGAGSASSDGLWFISTGDGGAGRNFRALAGDPAGAPVLIDESIYFDRDGDGLTDNRIAANDYSPYTRTVFPEPTFEFRGIAGKAWVPVEIRQYRGVVTLKMNGYMMATYTNATAYTNGTIMIGYMDIFNSVPGVPEENFGIFDSVRVERIRTVTVTTTNNVVNAADGQTSFLEALQGLQDNDVIAFNIPGSGPHYIVTPQGGYPIITNHNVTIDGYTQPGSSMNSAASKAPNNAQIRIVLDSRTGGRRALPDINGFGDSESGIFALDTTTGFTLKGVSVLSRQTAGSGEDPAIYGIALINACRDTTVQGCWFGVDPANPTVAGIAAGRAAIAGFRWDAETYASGLRIGTDSDGMMDSGEGNLFVGHGLALALEVPNTQIVGNWFNFLPGGQVVNYEALGFGGENTFEAIENGAGANNIIGTDGNFVNDANEGNVFGPVYYDHFIEFYTRIPATNVIVAGNYVNVGLNGAPLTGVPAAPAFLGWSRDGSGRVGAAIDPALTNDVYVATRLASANRISALGFNTNYDRVLFNLSDRVAFSFRGNQLLGNFGQLPIATNQMSYYDGVMTNSTTFKPTISSNSTVTTLIGSVPQQMPAEDGTVMLIEVDLYLANLAGAGNTSEGYPKGWVQGETYIGSYFENGPVDDGDANLGPFSFDISALNLTTNDLERLTIAANYIMSDGRVVTSVFADTIGTFNAPPSSGITGLRATAAGDQVTLTWAEGTAPFLVQGRPSLGSGGWLNLASTSQRTFSLPITTADMYFRVVSGSAASVQFFRAALTPQQETHTVTSPATGSGFVALEGTNLTYVVAYSGLLSSATAAHIHGPAGRGTNAGVLLNLVPAGGFGRSGILFGTAGAAQNLIDALGQGNTYFNIHTTNFPAGEVRGQLER